MISQNPNKRSRYNNNYANEDNKFYGKDLYKDYRVYSDNYSNKYYSSNDSKNMNYDDNRYFSSKSHYDISQPKKGFYNDSKYMDKRKSGFKGNFSSCISGNKFIERDHRSRSRSRSRLSRSKSRSWGKRSSHSRYRNRDFAKREKSHSNSVNKFNNNFK